MTDDRATTAKAGSSTKPSPRASTQLHQTPSLSADSSGEAEPSTLADTSPSMTVKLVTSSILHNTTSLAGYAILLSSSLSSTAANHRVLFSDNFSSSSLTSLLFGSTGLAFVSTPAPQIGVIRFSLIIAISRMNFSLMEFNFSQAISANFGVSSNNIETELVNASAAFMIYLRRQSSNKIALQLKVNIIIIRPEEIAAVLGSLKFESLVPRTSQKLYHKCCKSFVSS